MAARAHCFLLQKPRLHHKWDWLRLGKRDMGPEGSPNFSEIKAGLSGVESVQDRGRTRGVQSLDGFSRQVQEVN